MNGKKVFFDVGMHDNNFIKGWYIVDKFNGTLQAGMRIKNKSLAHMYEKEVVSEAYDHYNHANPDNQFIHPSAIVDE